jgi:hypothetical protein
MGFDVLGKERLFITGNSLFLTLSTTAFHRVDIFVVSC